MAREPGKIEIPGDVITPEEIATPITKSQRAKSKTQKGKDTEQKAADPAQLIAANDGELATDVANEVATNATPPSTAPKHRYTQKEGNWVLTAIGWQYHTED